MQSLSTLTVCTLYAGIIHLVLFHNSVRIDGLQQLIRARVVSIVIVIYHHFNFTVFLAYLSCLLLVTSTIGPTVESNRTKRFSGVSRLESKLFLATRNALIPVYVLQRCNRVSGSRGSDFGRVGSGHGSVCQTRCLTRFWVLTCAFIVALFLRSNAISANWYARFNRFRFGSRHSTTGLLISVNVRNIYLRADCHCDVTTFLDLLSFRLLTGSGRVGSKILTRFHLWRVAIGLFQFGGKKKKDEAEMYPPEMYPPEMMMGMPTTPEMMGMPPEMMMMGPPPPFMPPPPMMPPQPPN